MKYPKRSYIRSEKLLRLVASLNCQWCNSHTMIQAAHSNWGHGKGRGIKADDNQVAALCLKCHYEIDQGKNLSREERQKMWTVAHSRTVDTLLARGEWPAGVPLPQKNPPDGPGGI